jgi:hypothetical protein
MKNCDPLVFGPEFAIDKIPALLWVKCVVNRIKKGDFIRKLTIIRIGEKANNFQTDEAAFQRYGQGYNSVKFFESCGTTDNF